jgi:hypothetical protein
MPWRTRRSGPSVAQGNPNTATLSGMCLFRSAPTQSLERLTPLLHERSLPAGASVLAAEQPGEAVYVLLRAPSRSTSSRPAGEVISAIK